MSMLKPSIHCSNPLIYSIVYVTEFHPYGNFKPPKFQIPAMFSLYLQSLSAQFSHSLNKRSLVTVLQSFKIWGFEIKDIQCYSKLKSQSCILCVQNYAYGYFYCKHGTNWNLASIFWLQSENKIALSKVRMLSSILSTV